MVLMKSSSDKIGSIVSTAERGNITPGIHLPHGWQKLRAEYRARIACSSSPTQVVERTLISLEIVAWDMLLSIWEMFQSLFRRGEKTDEETAEEADEGRFVPSPLDLSVRIAHGGSDDNVARELSKIDEQARELENSRRRN